MSIFTPTLVGLFCLVIGVLSVIAMSRLLPERVSPEDALQGTNTYTVELMVPTMSSLVGKTVKEARLDQVDGGHLIEIIRLDKEVITAVDAEEFIFGGDRLMYSGLDNYASAWKDIYEHLDEWDAETIEYSLQYFNDPNNFDRALFCRMYGIRFLI